MKLIHPIYLDVPMLVSFAAAIQGGLAFTSEVTEQTGQQKSKSESAKARLGFSQLFSALFDASVSLEAAQADQKQDQQVRKESKAHTEASIAILLYEQLRAKSDLLFRPTSVADLQESELGALVEFSGVLSKNAVDAVIDYMDAVGILSTLNASSTKGGKAKQQPLQQLRDALDRDRQRTPIANALLQCDDPLSLTAVLTLRTENLRDLTLSELHKNKVHVVGKVSRFVPQGESMSSFENYGLGLVQPSQLEDLFDNITTSQNMLLDFSPVTIEGPAVQVLPLMIFV